MSGTIEVLGIYGGSEVETENYLLRRNLTIALQKLERLGASTEFCHLKDTLGKELIGNARPNKEIRPGLQEIAAKVRMCDILILATPVHWRYPSLLMMAFNHLVLAPLEWGGKHNGGYELKGKVCGIMTIFDDDGAAVVEMTLSDMLGQMGLHRPPFNIHHTHILEPESEDGWHDLEKDNDFTPELMAAARDMQMRGSPAYNEYIHG